MSAQAQVWPIVATFQLSLLPLFFEPAFYCLCQHRVRLHQISDAIDIFRSDYRNFALEQALYPNREAASQCPWWRSKARVTYSPPVRCRLQEQIGADVEVMSKSLGDFLADRTFAAQDVRDAAL